MKQSCFYKPHFTLSRYIRKIDVAVCFGILLSVLLANFAVFGQECQQVRSKVLRLHILANSDSQEDQRVKLAVRDRILLETEDLFFLPQSQKGAKLAAQENIQRIEQAALEELRNQGKSYGVRAEVTNMYFTTRQYGDLSLPAGNYDAVRILLGDGGGKNWWCVMYPPMCIPAAEPSNSEEMQEIHNLNETPVFIPKLAVVELFETIFSQTE